MFRQVIVPLDMVSSADVVLNVASRLADRAGAALRLVTVASPGLDHSFDAADLDKLAVDLGLPNVTTEVIESNDVAGALCDAADGEGLVCIETHARGRVASVVLGSQVSNVVRHSSSPVLLVGPATLPNRPVGLIEAALDLPDAADALVPVVGEWSRDLALAARLVHVTLAGGDRAASAGGAGLLDDAAARLAALGVEATTEVLRGQMIPTALVDDAAHHDASIVIVGLRHPGARRHRVLGTVANAVAHASPAPVLVVPIA